MFSTTTQHQVEDSIAKGTLPDRRRDDDFESIIGDSDSLRYVLSRVEQVSDTDATVLLFGETGTGKELLAHAIHAGSVRAERPFISVNLAAVPETLLEAEFFGVAPGAYTGADRKGRDGKFRLADGGTLFLDEIGDMPLALQAKLLRALQEQEFEPLGSNQVIKVDVRVIAATSRDLRKLMSEGRFREDLYYRLHVLPIRLPTLRDRLSDLEALAESLLEGIAVRTGMPQRELAPSALAALASYPWPGNVRELRNLLEQAAMLTDSQRLSGEDFAAILPTEAAVLPAEDAAPRALRPLPQLIAEIERNSIESALAATGGNKASAAKLLGISRATLYERLAALKRLSA